MIQSLAMRRVACSRYTGRKRRYEFCALTIALIAHASFFAWLCASLFRFELPDAAFLRNSQRAPLEVAMIDLSAQSGMPGMPAVGMDAAGVRSLIDRRLAEAENLSEEERRKRARDAIAQSGAVKQESIGEIANLMSVDTLQYQPKENPPPGRFDVDHSTIHDLKKIKNDKGENGYRIIFVDRDGRTMEGEEFGATARKWDNLYNVLQMSKENPAFGALYHQLIKPMLAEMAQQRMLAKTRQQPQSRKAEPAAKPKTPDKSDTTRSVP